MPKLAQKLGDSAVGKINAPGLHFVGGVQGLALQVNPAGARSWSLRVVIGGHDGRDMGLGPYPGVTLAMARRGTATHASTDLAKVLTRSGASKKHKALCALRLPAR